MAAGDPWSCIVGAFRVRDTDRRPLAVVEPAVAPGAEGEHDMGQIGPLVREAVLMTDGVLFVFDAFEDAICNESLEPVRDDGLLCADVCDEVREPRPSVERIPNEHQTPPVADLAQGPRDRTGLIADLLQFHVDKTTGGE